MCIEYKSLDLCHGHVSVDYYPHGLFDVTFPANQTNVSFNISLIDDNEVEKDEKLIVEIHNPNLPDGVKLQDPDSCEVTIIDTTSKSIMLYRYFTGHW